LLIVAAVAVLVLGCLLAAVIHKTHGLRWRELVRDQAEDDGLRIAREELLTDEADAKAHAARIGIDIVTRRARKPGNGTAAREARPRGRA
jgi:hypothetical protein